MADIKSILFPTDFSEHANKSFPYAEALAKAFGAKLILLHISELEEADPANPAHSFPALDAFAGELETERIMIRGHAPYKDILDVSRAKGCDLIVMATHGRSALAQFFLGGSIAEEVSRFSEIPVFIVKIEPDTDASAYTGNLKEVLFATDFSENSAKAFPYAVGFAEKFGAKLYALHVTDEDSTAYYASNGISRDDADFQARVEALLKDFVGGLAGASAVTAYHVAEGRAESEIVRFAEAQGIDLIALSGKGHNNLGDAILGTTTERVIRHAHCPVLEV